MKAAFTLLALLPIVLALPSSLRRQSEVDCGGDEYTQDEIAAAANAAYNYLSEGTTAGDSKYPEHYEDYEGFTFNGVLGPYYEFPLLSDGEIYDGGEPGADRVVITSDGTIAGEITHTGASGNDFVACSGTD